MNKYDEMVDRMVGKARQVKQEEVDQNKIRDWMRALERIEQEIDNYKDQFDEDEDEREWYRLEEAGGYLNACINELDHLL